MTPTLPVVLDNCGTTLTPTGPIMGGTYTTCEGTNTYTYLYTDCEGNTHDWVYTYTIERQPFPNPPDAGSTIACPALAVTPIPPVVVDNCGTTLTPTGPTLGGTYTSCEGTKTFTWLYTDCEGNTQDWVYTYTIEREPFLNPPDAGSTIACPALAVTPVPPVVVDNCGTTLTPTGPTLGGTYTSCEGTKTFTWLYTDCEGNTQDWVYTYTIEREPFLNPPDAGSTIACPALAVTPIPPVVVDNCGTTLTPTGPTLGGTYTSCEGTKTFTWLYTDCEGNTQDWVYTYTIEREPFLNPPDAGSTIACPALAVTPVPPVVVDNCGTTLTPTGPTLGGTYTSCEGTKTFTWLYTDCEGNTQDWVYTYTIERLPFNESCRMRASTIACPALAVTPIPPVVVDNCGTTLTPTGPTLGGTYTSCEGTKTFTWLYTDCEGNTQDWVYTYTIEREPFLNPPDAGSTIACPALAVTPIPPVVVDNCGTTLTPTGPTLGGTYTSCEGTKTFTWLYTDCEGNTQDWVYTYTIEREPFLNPPDAGSTIACPALAVTPIPPVVVDNCGTTLTPTGPTLGGTYTSCEGTKTFTWLYTDCEGNTQDWVYTYTIERDAVPESAGCRFYHRLPCPGCDADPAGCC